MWERFTQQAKHVVLTARLAAVDLGSEHVRTEHLLFGFCREVDGIAAEVLARLGVDVNAMALEIERRAERGSATVSDMEITFAPQAKKVLERCVEEARQFGHRYIGTEHFLLGLVAEGDGLAAEVLQEMKVDLARVRPGIVDLLGSQATQQG